MDNKRLLLNVVLVLAVFLLWQLGLNLAYKRHPGWRPQPTTAPVATAPGAASPAEPVPTATGPTPTVAALHAEDAGGTGTVFVGSAKRADPTYALELNVDPRGAGLSAVTLNDYFDTARSEKVYAFQHPVDGAPDTTRSLAVRSVTVDGRVIDLANVRWRTTASSTDAVTLVARIVDGTAPLLEVKRTYAVKHRDAADESRGYEVAVSTTLRNLTGRAITVSAVVNGPTPPTPENSRSEDRRFVTGFDEGDKFIKTGDTFVTDLATTKAAKDLVTVRPLPLLWVGACNSYFDAIVHPDAGPTGPIHIATAEAQALNDTTHDAAFTMSTAPVALAAGASAPFDVHAFFGPKQRQLLKNGYYSAFPRAYNDTLVYTSGPCGFLTFGWLIDTLYFILWCFHAVFRDWGLAIIGLVVLVRTCLHPITKRAQVNMMGMGKMGPEIERLKKKYGDDKDGLNKAMMGVYKEQGIAPVLGCLPMLLQTPIWLALWAALQSTFEMRQAPFLHFGWLKLTWIADLSQPDALLAFAHPLNLPFGYQLHGINVLPVLLAVVFFVQQSMMPKPATMTPEQEQQRKMMKFMPLIYPLFFYVSPSGLNLYILTSTSIGIVESKIVRDHIKQQEEAEKSGRIIVDAPVGKSKRRGGDDDGKGGRTPKKPSAGGGWLATKLAELQAKAEEVMKEAERKKGAGKR